MKFRLLQFLICPGCGKGLKVSVKREKRLDSPTWSPAQKCSSCALALYDPVVENNCLECSKIEVLTGTLLCDCGCSFPIIDAVPILIGGASGCEKQDLRIENTVTVQNRKTSVRFGYEWTRYPACFQEEEKDIFFEETQLEPGELQGKLVLDAGCGMGRFTRVAGSFAGEVIGVDLSESVHRAHSLTRHLPNVHIVQADLLRLPVRDLVFDIIYSLGVLHHTPDTAQAFARLIPKLRKGGIFTGWVYGAAGKYEDFKTNPLRSDRAKFVRREPVKRVYWAAVLLREKCSNSLRRLTVRLPHRALYAVCYLLALLGKIPLVQYLTFSVHPAWRVRLLENFDWLAPPFQHHHTKEELLAWCAKDGVFVEKMLQHGFIPKVGMRGKKERASTDHGGIL